MADLKLSLRLGRARRSAAVPYASGGDTFALGSAPRQEVAARPSLGRAGSLVSAPGAAFAGRPSGSRSLDLLAVPGGAGQGRPDGAGAIGIGLAPALPGWSTDGASSFRLDLPPGLILVGRPSAAAGASVTSAAVFQAVTRPEATGPLDLALAPVASGDGSAGSSAPFSDGTLWSDGTGWVDG